MTNGQPCGSYLSFTSDALGMRDTAEQRGRSVGWSTVIISCTTVGQQLLRFEQLMLVIRSNTIYSVFIIDWEIRLRISVSGCGLLKLLVFDFFVFWTMLVDY